MQKAAGSSACALPTAFAITKGRERHFLVAHGPLARSVAANQLWSLRKLGAVWLRAYTPSGPKFRSMAWKISVVMSFIVAIAMLQSTFLVLIGCTKVASAVLSSTFAASISRERRACQAAFAQTLGGCFAAFAEVPQKSCEFAPEQQIAKRYSRAFARIRRYSCELGYSLAIQVGGAQ